MANSQGARNSMRSVLPPGGSKEPHLKTESTQSRHSLLCRCANVNVYFFIYFFIQEQKYSDSWGLGGGGEAKPQARSVTTAALAAGT
jgi:hypothetical protein